MKNTAIKIPAKLLRLASSSGSSVADDKNQVPSVNTFNVNMNMKILLTGSHTFSLVFLGRIQIRISLLKLLFTNRNGNVKDYIANDPRIKFGKKRNNQLGVIYYC